MKTLRLTPALESQIRRTLRERMAGASDAAVAVEQQALAEAVMDAYQQGLQRASRLPVKAAAAAITPIREVRLRPIRRRA